MVAEYTYNELCQKAASVTTFRPEQPATDG